MARDPAIEQAEKLWQAKEQKRAVGVLVRRINELNAELASTRRKPEVTYAIPPAPKLQVVKAELTFPRWLKTLGVVFAAIFLMVAIGLTVLYVIVKVTEDDVANTLQMNWFCIQRDGAYCAEWRNMVQDEYEGVLDSCRQQHPETKLSLNLGYCLVENGVPEPDTWVPEDVRRSDELAWLGSYCSGHDGAFCDEWALMIAETYGVSVRFCHEVAYEVEAFGWCVLNETAAPAPETWAPGDGAKSSQ